MKRKLLPPFVMLTAGLITSIRTFYLNYDTKSSLIILLIVLVIFYGLGSALKFMLDTFEKENEKAAIDEGEAVINEEESAAGAENEAEDSITEE